MASQLRREIQQKRPFSSPEQEAFLNLKRTANLLTQQEGCFLKAFKLTPTQYNALRILRGARPDVLPCHEVGARMVTPVPDVTRLLDRLESRGLVSRSRDSDDRRVVNVKITPAGLTLIDEIDAPLRRWVRATLGHMDPEALQQLVTLLEEARRQDGRGSR